MQNASGGDLVLEFDDGGLLRMVRHASNGYVYLEQRAGGASPWRLELRERAGQTRTVTAFDAHACHVESVGAGLRLTWREIGNASDVVVHASLTPQEDGLAWRLAVDGLHPDAALWQANFPVLDGIRPIGQGDEEQWLLPKWGGCIVRNATRVRLSELDDEAACFSYPCDLTMQFVAYYRQGGDGLLAMTQDQIGFTQPQMCNAPQHGHPAGGGNHWCEGYRTLMQGVRRAAQAHLGHAILPTEGSCEAYLDLFDAFLVLDNSFERMGFYDRLDLNWESVPLFAAVYHDYALHFGSCASLVPPPYDDLWPQPQGPVRSQRFRERDFADAFYAELGRAFAAGAQPIVSNVFASELDDPSLQEHWRFLRELVHTRLYAAPFLVYGTWLRPPRLVVPETPVDFLVRGIYTPPDKEHVIQRRLPAVLASLWAAPDGRLGLALANISRDSQHIAWRQEGVSTGQRTSLIDGRGRIPLGRVCSGGVVFDGAIPGRSVRVIKVSNA